MRLILFFLYTIASQNSNAQVISGSVVDEQGPLEFASVRLFNVKDSTVSQGIYTSADGSFKLSDVAPGNYYMKISFSNFVTQLIDPLIVKKSDVINLGEIKLSIDKTLELEGVIAIGSLDALKAGIDKKIYNVADDITVKGGNVNDVLNNIPSIEVDQDGNISLRGDGSVKVLIDGRPSGLVLGDGKNLLSSIPANSIERIEVVTNPSAKYDPDGTSGIINIVMKKNKLKGFNGIVTGTVATGNQYEGSFALSYRSKRFNSYMNYSYDYYEGYRDYYSVLNRQLTLDSSILLIQNREGTDLKSGNSAVLGTDFFINDRNVLGISVTGALGTRDRYGYMKNEIYDGNQVFINKWDRISKEPRSNRNVDINLNYTYKLKEEKGELSFVAYQSFGENSVKGFFDQLYYANETDLITLSPLNQRLNNIETNTITTVQTDFSYVLKKMKARIETGAKMSRKNELTDTKSETRDTISGLFYSDTLANFKYQYTGNEYSTYFIFGQVLGKFKYQAGLRGEFAIQNPQLLSSLINYRSTYLNIFPSAHLKYDLSKKSEIGLSYSRRINRPSSDQLNPFISYADPFNLRGGNPKLKPEYIDSYDFSYSLTKEKIILSMSAYYRRTTDVINRVKYYRSDNTSIVTNENIDKSESTGFEAILIYKPYKWMKNTFSFNGNYINYTNSDPSTNWNNDGFNWGVKYTLNVEFWKKTASLQASGNYSAPRVTPQGIFQRGNMVALGVEKRMFDNKFLIGVRVTDLFNTLNTTIKLDSDGVQQNTEFKWLTRRVFFTLTYKFGQFDKKKLPKAKSEGGDE